MHYKKEHIMQIHPKLYPGILYCRECKHYFVFSGIEAARQHYESHISYLRTLLRTLDSDGAKDENTEDDWDVR